MSAATLKYLFDDLGDVSCADVAKANEPLLMGRVAVNTSFDSGLLTKPNGSKVGKYYQTQTITKELINNWPVSHDEFCDEWWVFDRVTPEGFTVKAFCNYTNLRIADYKQLDWDNGCPLDRYLSISVLLLCLATTRRGI